MIPWYFAVIDVLIAVGVAFAVWTIFATQASRGFRVGLGLFLGAWVVLVLATAVPPVSLLSRSGFLINPLIPVLNIASAVLVILFAVVSPTARRALASVSLPAIHGVQVFRLAGFTFILLLAQGRLPANFALPAGLGDMFIGVTALPIAYALARGVTGSRALAITWNVLGVIDLVIAVGTGTGLMVHQPPAGAMGAFPEILIPAFAVPVAMILHVLSLSRLVALSAVSSARHPSATPIHRPGSLAN